MTLDELNTIGEVARQKCAREGGSIAAMTRAKTRAMVEALRDDMTLGWEDDRPWGDVADVKKFLNKILASDGEDKAAGASTRKDEGESVSDDAHKAASPAANHNACEWERISEAGYLTHYLTPHGVTNDFYRWHPYNECARCGKPIKFKEAAR